MPAPELPPRYEPVSPLGKGGGGEVWAVRDRLSGRTVRAEDARRARDGAGSAGPGARSGGALRARRAGRAAGAALRKAARHSGRPFLVRELVEGQSLLELIEEGAEPSRCLGALALRRRSADGASPRVAPARRRQTGQHHRRRRRARRRSSISGSRRRGRSAARGRRG